MSAPRDDDPSTEHHLEHNVTINLSAPAGAPIKHPDDGRDDDPSTEHHLEKGVVVDLGDGDAGAEETRKRDEPEEPAEPAEEPAPKRTRTKRVEPEEPVEPVEEEEPAPRRTRPARRAKSAAEENYAADIAQYVGDVDQDAIDAIVKYSGNNLKSRDGKWVSGTDPKELAGIRDRFAANVLGLSKEEADEAIADVVEEMHDENNKSRVTFYYLLAHHTGRLSKLTGKTEEEDAGKGRSKRGGRGGGRGGRGGKKGGSKAGKDDAEAEEAEAEAQAEEAEDGHAHHDHAGHDHAGHNHSGHAHSHDHGEHDHDHDHAGHAHAHEDDEPLTGYAEDVAKHASGAVSQAAVDAIVAYSGPALKSRDAKWVSATDPRELATVRDGFAAKKLGLSKEEADAAIARVVERMEGVTNKSRVTFYYLLAEETGTLDKLAA